MDLGKIKSAVSGIVGEGDDILDKIKDLAAKSGISFEDLLTKAQDLLKKKGGAGNLLDSAKEVVANLKK